MIRIIKATDKSVSGLWTASPEWIFFQREQDIKKGLYKRYMDKARQQQELYSADSAPLETETSIQQKAYYAKAKISE